MTLEIKTGNQTIINDVSFEYSENLNELNRAILNIDGNTNFQRSLLTVGSVITILRNGSIEFIGKINSVGNFDGNGVKLIARGEEEEYIKKNVTKSNFGTNGVYTNTASASIYSDILNEGVTYSAGSIATGVNLDFKVSDGDSLFNTLLNLHTKTGQEHKIDYINKLVNVSNTLGSSNVDTLNQGSDFDFMEFNESEPKAKKVIVYGKGDGSFQITGTATDAGFIEGTHNTIVIRDPTIISNSEASKRANIELNKFKENIKTYRIPVTNPFKNYALGDTIKINAPSYGVIDEEVRIVRLIRGRKGRNEYLNIEVTNANYSRTFKNAQQKIAEETLKNRNKDTFMQGSGNTLNFNAQINGNNTYPLSIPFNLPESFIKDESGNIRVNSFTFDYDIDPFRKGAGGVSVSGDLLVSGTSSFDDPFLQSSSSASTQPSVTGSVENSPVTPRLSGSLKTYVDTDLNYTATTSYSTRCSVTLAENYDLIVMRAMFDLNSSTSNLPDLHFRLRIAGTSYIYDKLTFLDASIENQYYISHIIPFVNNSAGIAVDLLVKKDSISVDLIFDSIELRVTGILADHTHADGGGLSASNHGHANGNYQVDNHGHGDGSYDIPTSEFTKVTIGDIISDAASVNATAMDWKLYYFNGSTWDLKNSGTRTFPVGLTFEKNIDISNGGVYPDNSGDWRLDVFTNTVNGDLIKSNINIKHNLDN